MVVIPCGYLAKLSWKMLLKRSGWGSWRVTTMSDTEGAASVGLSSGTSVPS